MKSQHRLFTLAVLLFLALAASPAPAQSYDAPPPLEEPDSSFSTSTTWPDQMKSSAFDRSETWPSAKAQEWAMYDSGSRPRYSDKSSSFSDSESYSDSYSEYDSTRAYVPQNKTASQPATRQELRARFKELPQDQQQAVRGMVRAHREKQQLTKQELAQLQVRLNAKLGDPSASREEIDRLADQISELKARQYRDRVDLKRSIFEETGVLIPDRK